MHSIVARGDFHVYKSDGLDLRTLILWVKIQVPCMVLVLLKIKPKQCLKKYYLKILK